MAERVVSLAARNMSLPPRYEYLLELAQGGGARCHLAIDPGSDLGDVPLGAGAHAAREGGPASAACPALACSTGVAAGDRALPTRRLVAVHWAPPPVAEDDELRAQFAARAAAFLPLRHPNLVTTFEAVAERRQCHWVSEFVPGEPLSRLLERTKRGRRALSTRQILAIVCDVTHALEYTHGAVDTEGLPRPIVHGNVCPASVLVTYDGVVKVSAEISGALREVSAGPFVGRPARLAYLAPECCSGAPGDARCDVYALGAILWEALASRPRSLGLTPQQVVALRLRGAEPELENVCPDVLPALAAVTRRALSTDPGDRHQSVGALREELEAISGLGVLRYETSQLFGFMCNHFCDEHAALQALLEGHSMLHALVGEHATSQTGSHTIPRASARAMSKTGSRPRSPTDASVTLQSPLEERAGGFNRASGAGEVGRYPSLRDSGWRLSAAGVQPRTTPPPVTSRLVPIPPLARLQPLQVALRLARGFCGTGTSVVVLVAAAALTVLALSWAGNGTVATGPFERPEPAAVVPSVRPQPAESMHAEKAGAPASAPSSPSPLGSPVSVEAAKAIAGSPVPERGIRRRLRPVRGDSPSRARRRDRQLEHAAGTVTRTHATRDVARLFELDEEPTDGAGADLRMLKERPPRAIDKQDPYSP